MAIGRHAARENEPETVHGAGRTEGVLGRLRHALVHAFSGERLPRDRTGYERAHGARGLLEPPGRTRSRREPGDGHATALTDEAAVMAAQHERALRRVAVAANEACEDWERGLDIDEAMVRLRAELQTAAEYEA
jgi:hypothetical protein